jgi:hypothetical protein
MSLPPTRELFVGLLPRGRCCFLGDDDDDDLDKDFIVPNVLVAADGDDFPPCNNQFSANATSKDDSVGDGDLLQLLLP